MIFKFFTRDFPVKKIKWKKFLKGFLWKIEAGGKILKGFPFKFTTWLVLHVLHFIGNFFYNPRASLARAAFKRDFLVKLKATSFFWSKLRKVKFKGISFKSWYLQNFLWSPLSTSYPHGYKRNPFKNFSEQKKIDPEISSQKYTLGPTS